MTAIPKCLLLLAAMTCQAKPNLAGEWKLNAERSDFGPLPALTSMVMKITHSEPDLKVLSKVISTRGEENYDLKFKTGGAETVNHDGPTEMKTTSDWDGETLLMKTRAIFQDADLTLVDRWDLSDEGRTLTIRRHISSSRGEIDQKMVLEKQ